MPGNAHSHPACAQGLVGVGLAPDFSIESKVPRVVVGKVQGFRAVADNEELHKALERFGIAVSGIVLVLNDLFHRHAGLISSVLSSIWTTGTRCKRIRKGDDLISYCFITYSCRVVAVLGSWIEYDDWCPGPGSNRHRPEATRF